MKTIKIFASVAISSMVLSSCGDMLNVTNPNYFTEEEMAEYLANNPEANDKVVSGLTADLYKYVTTFSENGEGGDATINGGYGNHGSFECYKDFCLNIMSGDIVEGDASHLGNFAEWYQNVASNAYWETDQLVNNYGYYYAAVRKVGPAQKALDVLTEEYVAANPTQGYGRAQALTLKAIAYMQLMEKYTDLQDVESTTKQGWPVYDEFAYNAAVEPLSVKATWDWIMDAFDEAVTLFHQSSLGNQGYTFGTSTDLTKYYDLDCAVCQYFRCRAALDCKRYDVAIAAGEDLLSHYTSFIDPAHYGMPESKMAEVDRTEDGHGWKGEYNADQNAFLNTAINPEAIFATAGSTTLPQTWAHIGFNGNIKNIDMNTGLNPFKNTILEYFQMDQKLYDSMDKNDCRRNCFLSKPFEGLDVFTVKADTTWYSYTAPAYTSLKWAATSGFGSTNHDIKTVYANTVYYRSAAVVLMVAEAYVGKGNGSKAAEWLNKLLKARSIDSSKPVTVGSSADLAAVQTQWRIEMWGEGDWAFINLKRWNKTGFERGSNNYSKNQINKFTWDIPKEERQGNPYWD